MAFFVGLPLAGDLMTYMTTKTLAFGMLAWIAGTTAFASTGQISLLSDQFVSQSPVSSSRAYGGLNAKLLHSGKSFHFASEILISDRQSEHSFLNIEELSTTISRLRIGRHKRDWNYGSQQWATGLIEPLHTYNPLRKTSQGLTGVFYDFGVSERLNASIFVSGIYIPNQGASAKVENGQFVQTSPWTQLPTSTVSFRGREIPINYQILTPEIRDVVLQPSAIASLTFQSSSELSVNLLGGRKPMNQLALGFDGTMNLSTDQVDAEILPKVVNHSFLAADIEWSGKPASFIFSFYADQPDEVNFDSKYTYQRFDGTQIYMPTVVFYTKGFSIDASYFHREGGDGVQIGEFAEGGSNFLPSRFDFKRAARLGVSGSIRSLRGRFQVTQELESQSTLLGANAQYALSPDWNLFTGFDLIASLAESNVDLLSSHRNSDRLYGGFSYVF